MVVARYRDEFSAGLSGSLPAVAPEIGTDISLIIEMIELGAVFDVAVFFGMSGTYHVDHLRKLIITSKTLKVNGKIVIQDKNSVIQYLALKRIELYN